MVFVRKDGVVKPHKKFRWANELQIAMAAVLLEEMEENHHEVSLAPAPEQRHSGHMIRVTTGFSAGWYSEMAACKGLHTLKGSKVRYGSLRKKVTHALKRVQSGWYNPGGLEGQIFECALEHLIRDGHMYPSDEDQLLETGRLKGLNSGNSNTQETIEEGVACADDTIPF